MNLFLNCEDNPITFNKKNYLLRAAERLGIEYVYDLKDRVDMSSDYILNIEPFSFKKGYKWTGIWEIDLLCDRPQTSASDWAVADVIYTAVTTIPTRLEGFAQKTKLLFQACDPDLHQRRGEPDTDFVISGSMDSPGHTERIRVTDIMKKEFEYLDFGNNRVPQDYVEGLSHARVQFIRSMGSNIASGELAQRFFECLALGPVLTNFVPDLVHTGLVEGQDYYSYKSDNEMIAKMKKLLADPKKAQAMAENGRSKALLYHTYEHRLMTILEDIRSHGDLDK